MREQNNILGTMPMGRLVIRMSLPIMLSMLMQAVYNLVDSLYVTQAGDGAFLALSYAYPVQLLMIAFCVGSGVGFNAMLARRLGERRQEDANAVVLHGFLLYLACWGLFLSFAVFGAGFYMRQCTATEAVAVQGTAYLRICCGLSIGICVQFPCERILQSTGHPAGFMIVQGSGALINILLDPILILHWNMGVRGAAIATVIGQIAGGVIGLGLLWGIRREFPIRWGGFRVQPAVLGEMCRIAAPAVLMQSLGSFMSLGLNAIFTAWSETAVWVLGVYFKLQSFVYMPVFSINNGLISIISYNRGAKERKRIRQAVSFGMLTAVSVAVFGAAVLWVCAGPLLVHGFHAAGPASVSGVPALRMTALAFPIGAVSIILSAAFQSLDRSVFSLLIALLRQLVLLLPAAYFLVRFAPQYAFLAFLLAELLTCFVSLTLAFGLRVEPSVSDHGTRAQSEGLDP